MSEGSDEPDVSAQIGVDPGQDIASPRVVVLFSGECCMLRGARTSDVQERPGISVALGRVPGHASKMIPSLGALLPHGII
eukprot:6212678-Amphidinium_carterae.1